MQHYNKYTQLPQKKPLTNHCDLPKIIYQKHSYMTHLMVLFSTLLNVFGQDCLAILYFQTYLYLIAHADLSRKYMLAPGTANHLT